ncbi:PAS domain S-box protein [Natronolimnobius sp. AArcel1]|uniref:PAS domain S-box protein n=1 Tax=Natronolimnobius sp. AArcel1 TaxID=1679093 RepID=UPI0013EB0493|nr:PAS domain S-box protein [Natronolimnobius sp. AArcel1]NGM69002.1 PAS domain S-box protein [Natronolimnobius sp. AArcel1]
MNARADADDDDGPVWTGIDDEVALRRYRTLVETIDDGVCQVDADGHFVAVNDRLVEMTGYSPDDLLGSSTSVLLADDDVNAIRQELEAYYRTGDTLPTFELAIKTVTGETVPCELRLHPLVDDGELQGTIAIAHERSPKRRLESLDTAATESREPPYAPLESILDQANVAAFVLNESFEVAWLDETTERYFGIDCDEIIGCDKRTLIEETVKHRFDDPDRFAETVLSTYESNDHIERFECHITDGDDREERWVEHYSAPVESGAYAGGRLEFYYDVTDRVYSEGAKRKTEAQFQSLIDAVEEYAIFRLDPDGCVVSWNDGANQIKGYTADEIIGEHFSTFYTQQDRAADVPEQNLEEALESGSLEDEGWRVRADGSRFWADATITPIHDEDGTHRGYLKVTRDMTDRYEREQDLENELQRIFGRIADGFYALDEDWQFTHVNDRATQILEVGEDDLLGESMWDAFPEFRETEFEMHYREAMETQESVSFEEYYPPRDSWFEVNVYPSETGLSVYFRDITDRVERERELELFRELLNHSNDSVFVIDPDSGRFLDVNDTACHQHGYARDELLELSVPDIETELPTQDAWESFAETVQADGPATFDGEHRRQDGTTFPVEVNASYVDLEQTYILAMVRDVTERRQRERKLEESERRYRTLAENFPNGIVTMFDEDGRYSLAAGQAFDELPVSPDDVEGSMASEVWPDRPAEKLESAFCDTLEGDQRVVDVEYAGREWVVRIVPLTDDSGVVFGGMTIAQDITARKERERALADSKRRYQTLVDHFPNGAVGLFDDELRYTIVGGSLLDELGLEAESIIGDRIYDRYPDDIVGEYVSYAEAVFDGEASTFELEYHDRDLFAHALPVRNADDEVYAGMLLVQDVTEQREYERKLERSNERLEQFAYAVSHDLQEPLRMVSSYLGLIENRYADELDDDAEEFIDFAVDGADRMREMIDALLAYSRVETQGNPLEPVDLDAVLENVLADLRLRIEETNAEIDVDTAELPHVVGDASQLRQVFQNLLDNALEYSDGRPQVTVDAERNGDWWTISVRDEGIGIDPDNQERIFEVFERLHSRDQHEGTGIGLALCRRIIERHGGDIRVDSERGEGTTFSFTLPAVDDGTEAEN